MEQRCDIRVPARLGGVGESKQQGLRKPTLSRACRNSAWAQCECWQKRRPLGVCANSRPPHRRSLTTSGGKAQRRCGRASRPIARLSAVQVSHLATSRIDEHPASIAAFWRPDAMRATKALPPVAHLVRRRFALAEPSLSFLVNRAPAAPSISIATLSSVPACASCARLIRTTLFDTSPRSCTLAFVA